MSEPSGMFTEVAIIGAGPAGMAAALRLVDAGLRPLVLDQAPAPGGQIYRHVDAPQLGVEIMGPDYLAGQALVRRFADAAAQGHIDYRASHRVWWSEADEQTGGVTLGVLDANGGSRIWRADRLLVASGAMERSWPFPGWQLPGVMQAGAAQILLKQGALLTDSAPVLAGSGPLLYLLAWQYLRAGHAPRLILDTASGLGVGEMLRRPRQSFRARGYLSKGLMMMMALRRAGVPVLRGLEALRGEGDERLERISYRRGGRWESLEADWLLTHMGVVPEPQLNRGLGIEHGWSDDQQAFVARRSPRLETLPNVWLAGDAAGIGGAVNAEREGRLAALGLLEAQQKDWQSESVIDEFAAERRVLERARAIDLDARQLLDALFRPPAGWLWAQSETTLVCRCESITRGQLERAIEQGAFGPNQLKAFTRCGMGPCQGRICGDNVARLLAARKGSDQQDAHGVDPGAEQMNAVGYYHIRPPLCAITLGELAATSDLDADTETASYSQ